MATDSLTRLDLLKQVCRERGWVQTDGSTPSPTSLGRAINRRTNQCSDLLNGRARFGEDIARHIEASLGLPRFYLDGGVPDFSNEAITVAMMLDRVKDSTLRSRIYSTWSTIYDALTEGRQIPTDALPVHGAASSAPHAAPTPMQELVPAKKTRTG